MRNPITIARHAPRALLCTLFLLATACLACSGSSASSSPDKTTPTESDKPAEPPVEPGVDDAAATAAATAALTADVGTLCQRYGDKSMSGWSQPVFRTEEMRELTQRADAGTEDAQVAKCEIAKLAEKQGHAACNAEVVESLLSFCQH